MDGVVEALLAVGTGPRRKLFVGGDFTRVGSIQSQALAVIGERRSLTEVNGPQQR